MRKIVYILGLMLLSCGKNDHEKGMICLRQGDATRAILFLEKAVLESPENMKSRKALAQALQQQVTRLDPSSAEVSLVWSKMIDEYKVVYGQGDSSVGVSLQGVWLEWCDMLLRKQDSSRAEKEYEQLIQWFPQNLTAHNEAALLAYRRAQWEKSEKLWMDAIGLDSISITAPFNLGMSYWMRGNPKLALKHWVTAFERNPLDTNVVTWMVEAQKALGK